MIALVIMLILLMLVAIALMLRYERWSEREPEHGALTESFFKCVPRGIKYDLSSARQWIREQRGGRQ